MSEPVDFEEGEEEKQEEDDDGLGKEDGDHVIHGKLLSRTCSMFTNFL